MIRTMDTGEERVLSDKVFPRDSHLGSSLRWSPDGHSILVTGADDEGRRGIFEVSVRTGEVRPVIDGWPLGSQYSLDGESIFYMEPTPSGSILRRNLQTGEETELYRGSSPNSPRGYQLALSPDGKRLAFVSPTNGLGGERGYGRSRRQAASPVSFCR